MHYSFITRCFSLLIFTRQCSSQDVAFRTLPGQDANVSRISVAEDIHPILNQGSGRGGGEQCVHKSEEDSCHIPHGVRVRPSG